MQSDPTSLRNAKGSSRSERDWSSTIRTALRWIRSSGRSWYWGAPAQRFDERKSTCSLPIERLSYAPVIAVLAAMSCALLALGHIIQRCLPPLADSFFIFNANEDNRLCIDPVLVPPNNTPPEIPTMKRMSIIPVFSSSSEESNVIFEDKNYGIELRSINVTEEATSKADIKPEEARISNIKTITERIQDTFKSFTFSKRRSSQKKQIEERNKSIV